MFRRIENTTRARCGWRDFCPGGITLFFDAIRNNDNRANKKNSNTHISPGAVWGAGPRRSTSGKNTKKSRLGFVRSKALVVLRNQKRKKNYRLDISVGGTRVGHALDTLVAREALVVRWCLRRRTHLTAACISARLRLLLETSGSPTCSVHSPLPVN
jgi:hypothetical protein